EKLAHSHKCTLIQSEKLEGGTKEIDGYAITKDYWNRADTYLCRHEDSKCPYLNAYQCAVIKKECKQHSNSQCSLWEFTFKCLKETKYTGNLKTEELFGLNEQLWDTPYQPSTSFSEATTKLKIFDELKQQFENSQQIDVTTIE